jgi:hypothetical protein
MRAHAKFWTYVGLRAGDGEDNPDGESWLLIRLYDGESYVLSSGGQSDEGYDITHETFTNSDGVVTCELDSTARDCDGRFDRHETYTCPVGLLQDKESPLGVRTPAWTKVDSSQRDYSAERAGY